MLVNALAIRGRPFKHCDGSRKRFSEPVRDNIRSSLAPGRKLHGVSMWPPGVHKVLGAKLVEREKVRVEASMQRRFEKHLQQFVDYDEKPCKEANEPITDSEPLALPPAAIKVLFPSPKDMLNKQLRKETTEMDIDHESKDLLPTPPKSRVSSRRACFGELLCQETTPRFAKPADNLLAALEHIIDEHEESRKVSEPNVPPHRRQGRRGSTSSSTTRAVNAYAPTHHRQGRRLSHSTIVGRLEKESERRREQTEQYLRDMEIRKHLEEKEQWEQRVREFEKSIREKVNGGGDGV